jgi:hypothetical protein
VLIEVFLPELPKDFLTTRSNRSLHHPRLSNSIQLFSHGSTRFSCLVLNFLDEIGLILDLGYFDNLPIPKLMTLEPQSALKVKLFGTLASQCHPKVQAEQKLHQINLGYFIQTAICRTAQTVADLATNTSAGWVGKSN